MGFVFTFLLSVIYINILSVTCADGPNNLNHVFMMMIKTIKIHQQHKNTHTQEYPKSCVKNINQKAMIKVKRLYRSEKHKKKFKL